MKTNHKIIIIASLLILGSATLWALCCNKRSHRHKGNHKQELVKRLNLTEKQQEEFFAIRKNYKSQKDSTHTKEERKQKGTAQAKYRC